MWMYDKLIWLELSPSYLWDTPKVQRVAYVIDRDPIKYLDLLIECWQGGWQHTVPQTSDDEVILIRSSTGEMDEG